MTATAKSADRRRAPRRTQAERSGEARQRLLAATIQLLRSGGYSAANVKAIAADAGMSLGSLQHHFPTKAKLMTAVIERLAEKRTATLRVDADRVSDPLARYAGALDSTWALVKEPEFVAVLEILLARRSDPELWAESEGVIQANEAALQEWITGLASGVGEPPESAKFRRRVSNTVMYGLALQLAIGMDPEDVEDVFAFWKALMLLAGRHPELLPQRKRRSARVTKTADDEASADAE